MKHIKDIPQYSETSINELINNGWKKMNEPKKLITAILLSIPFILLNFFISIYFLSFINSDFSNSINVLKENISITFTINPLYIIYTYLFIFLHELLHLCLIPNFLKSNVTYISLKLWGGFVYSEEEIKKNRFLLITLFPYITLSFVVPYILNALGLLNNFICFLAIINAAASSVDILNFILVLTQVPSNSVLKNAGSVTLYKNNSIF